MLMWFYKEIWLHCVKQQHFDFKSPSYLPLSFHHKLLFFCCVKIIEILSCWSNSQLQDLSYELCVLTRRNLKSTI